MTEARLEASWDHTSALMALLANVNRDPKRHGPYRMEDFHPFRRRTAQGIRITRQNIGLLRKVFCQGK